MPAGNPSRTLYPSPSDLGVSYYDEHGMLEGLILKNEKNLPPTLGQGIVQYHMRLGDMVTAYTDMGHGRPENDDRIMINLFNNSISVNDGYGADGGIVADILSESQLYSRDPEAAVAIAVDRIKMHARKKSGVCFMQANIFRGKYLFNMQAGDVRRIIADKMMRLKWFWKQRKLLEESKDETLAQALCNAGQITQDLVSCHPKRNLVTNFVKSSSAKVNVSRWERPLLKGQRIYLLCDGITDNLTSEEILALTEGLSPELAIQVLIQITDTRMQWAMRNLKEEHDAIDDEIKERLNGKRMKFSDGFSSPPKPDNRSIAIIDVA